MNYQQRDLSGNVIALTEEEHSAHIRVTEYTRDLCRQFRVATPLQMQEAVEVSLKVLAAIFKIKISPEDVQRIKESKSTDEIISILQNILKSI